jgi:RNA recognition motif-containing protein
LLLKIFLKKMAKKLFVGNLNYTLTTDELKAIFSAVGEVEDCNIVIDKINNRSRGFGFVTLKNDTDLVAALALDGTDQGGRNMVVKEALPRPEKV